MTRSGWGRTTLGAVAAGVVLTSAGCGGGSAQDAGGSGSTHVAFLRSVDAVCARAVRAHAGHTFPVSGFDPESPDPSELPAVGDYFARYGGLPAVAAGLHALHPPRGEIAVWRDLLAAVDAMAINAERQVQAARTEDSGTFVTTVHAAHDIVDRINELGDRLGVSADSPCHQVFG